MSTSSMSEDPARSKISEKLLNEKIMQMLVSHSACANARSVFLESVRDASDGGNWRIGHFDPGNGDRYTCKITLRRIHEQLRDAYEMVGES